MQSSSGRQGRVITFYSYKGGTGRSMALSNIAWVLASAGKRVLMIDWDLEAPGLHRYFRPFLIDQELASSEGLMDLIDRYACEAIRPPPPGQPLPADWWLPLADISDHVLGIDFPGFPAGGAIDLLAAGRQCETYAVKVSAFNWQNFFDRLGGGGFLDAVRQRVKAEYDYVLIDSRTGVSDTAGICTAQMPDTLVVCFTYNNQSIQGAAAVAASAQRLQADVALSRRRAAQASDGGLTDSPQPLRIYPVPMRVDAGESDRLALRQAYAREAFAPLLGTGTISDLPAYWAAVEVPNRVFYAYEEVLAPFKDDAHDPKTVLSAFVRLAREITGGEVTDYRLPIDPGLRQHLLQAYAQTPQSATTVASQAASNRETEDEALTRHIETQLLALSEADRASARSVLGRLVRIGRDDEGGGVFVIRVALSEIDADQRPMVATLERSGLLTVTTEMRPGQTKSLGAEQILAPAHDRMFSLSPTLQAWLAEDREFLLWRQQLRAYRSDWDRSGDPSALLAGSPLAEARLWQRRRGADLNTLERQFLEASVSAAQAPAHPFPPVLAPAPETASAAMVSAPPAAAPSSMPPAMPSAGPPAAASPWPGRLAAVLADGAVLLVPAWLMNSRKEDGRPAAVPAAAPSARQPMQASGSPVPTAAAADALYEQGRLAEAETAYRSLLLLEPESQHALLQLGRIADRNGDFSSSAALYQRAIAQRPGEVQPLIERAASLMSQRRFTEALVDLDAAIALDANSALAHFNRGAANENLNRQRQAIADYGAAIDLDRGMVQAYLRRAALTETSNPAAARADYQSVLRLAASATALQTAQERLQALGGKSSKPAAVNPGEQRVFVQYSEAADRAAVEALRKALAAALAPVSVPGIDKVSLRSDGEVRYFFAEDRELALRVAQATELQLARTGMARQLKPTFRDAAAFPNAARGSVELWLPALSLVAPQRGGEAVKK